MTIQDICGRYSVDVPGNGISPTGIVLIQEKLKEWELGKIPEDRVLPPSTSEYWVWDWKIPGKGEYVGSLPKRLAKLVYHAKKIKLTSQQLSEVGNIGASHSGKHCQYWFDIVDDIDWEAGDFGDDGSCYWGNNEEAKEMLTDNGAGAIRFFQDSSYTDGIARAWIVPWKDCWIVFNGYGMETLHIARTLSIHLGHAYYRKAGLLNNGASDGTLWINGGSCYVVGPQESVLKYSSIDLKWEDEGTLQCSNCECTLSANYPCYNPEGEALCEECWADLCFTCNRCEETHWTENMRSTPSEFSYVYVCEGCWDDKYFTCACGKDFDKDSGIEGLDGKLYCSECWSEHYTICDGCSGEFSYDDLKQTDDGLYCEDCREEEEEKEEEACIAT